MTRRSQHELLASAAKRVARDPKFMASALSTLIGGEWDAHLISDVLGCETSAIVQIALCVRPQGASPQFRADVERIAALGGVSPGIVADAIRQAEALESFARGSEQELLAAARDHLVDSESDRSE